MCSNVAQIGGDKLNFFKLAQSSEKSGRMLSAARKNHITFQIQFGSKVQVKTYTHSVPFYGELLSDNNKCIEN